MTSIFHLSVDDVLPGLFDPAHPMIGTLDRLHDEFAMPMDLYLFGESDWRRLDELPPAMVNELRARPWLRLGPHGANVRTPPHRQSAAELQATLEYLFKTIEHIVGHDACSTWVRLHEFSEAYEAAPLLTAHGVEALLTTDKPAIAWRLPAPERAALALRGRVPFQGIDFVRTHLRIEWLVAEGVSRVALADRIRRIVDAHGFLVVFTHEVCFDDPRTGAMLHTLLDVCRALGLRPRGL
jgi:hypothetical protein